MYLLSGSTNSSLAKKVADLSGVPLLERDIENFMDGEIKILLKNYNLADKHITILQTLASSNHLMELCLLVDILKNSKVKKISVVIPYLFYTRQDKPKSGEAFSPKVVIKILEASGINDITFLDLHSTKIENLFSIPTKKLEVAPLLQGIITKDSILVAPDAGGTERAETIAQYFNLPLVHIEKTRLAKRKVSSKLEENNVFGKDCFIIDDIIDSGNTLCAAAKTLKDHGAKTVKAFCTHGVLSKDAWRNLDDSFLDHLFITNSLDVETKVQNISSISVINLAPLISQSLEK
jgi:ribose-phosphate pyrophosphokinase